MDDLAAALPSPSSPRLKAALAANLRLLEVAARLRHHWQVTARQVGLTGAQAKLLLGLGADEAATMRALAQRLGYDPSNLTTVVDRLERDGLLERSPHASDRRVTEVRLTVRGRDVRDRFWTALNAGGPLDSLTGAQLAALDDTLARVLDANRSD
jgi:DNA-binding MarR family transcriptional regulator